jgi:hypothetical protein
LAGKGERARVKGLGIRMEGFSENRKEGLKRADQGWRDKIRVKRVGRKRRGLIVEEKGVYIKGGENGSINVVEKKKGYR